MCSCADWKAKQVLPNYRITDFRCPVKVITKRLMINNAKNSQGSQRHRHLPIFLEEMGNYCQVTASAVFLKIFPGHYWPPNYFARFAVLGEHCVTTIGSFSNAKAAKNSQGSQRHRRASIFFRRIGNYCQMTAFIRKSAHLSHLYSIVESPNCRIIELISTFVN